MVGGKVYRLSFNRNSMSIFRRRNEETKTLKVVYFLKKTQRPICLVTFIKSICFRSRFVWVGTERLVKAKKFLKPIVLNGIVALLMTAKGCSLAKLQLFSIPIMKMLSDQSFRAVCNTGVK